MTALANTGAAAVDRMISLFRVGPLAATPESRDTERKPSMGFPQIGNADETYLNAFYNWRNMPETRLAEMKFYDFLETENPEIDAGLNAYASMATTGSTTGAKRNTFVAKVSRDADGAVVKRIDRLNNILKRHAFTTIRGMAKYGSYPAQIKIGEADGGFGVTDLDHLPPGTMHRFIKPDGTGDDQRYWYQMIDGHKSEQQIPRWKVPHFALWTQVVNAEHTLLYGTSVLRRCGRAALNLSACIDALAIARLTRATMKYVHKIDCTDLDGDYDAILRRLGAYRTFNDRQRVRLSGGNSSSYQRAPIPEDDFFVATMQGRDSGVEKIEGDANLGNIQDVEMLMTIFLGAVGVPPEYLGHERSQGGRSNLSQIDIQFARNARHLQWFGAGAFEHILFVDLWLAGIDPERVEAEVQPPPMGARDDLLKAQMMNLYSQAVVNMQTAGMDLTVNPEWVLRVFLDIDDELEGLDEDQLKSIFLDHETMAAAAAPAPDGGKQRNDPRRPANLSSEEVAVITKGTGAIRSQIRALLKVTGPEIDRVIGERPNRRDLMDHGELRRALVAQGLING